MVYLEYFGRRLTKTYQKFLFNSIRVWTVLDMSEKQKLTARLNKLNFNFTMKNY